MRFELLELMPKYYLCPYCGEWHEWKRTYNLLKSDLGRPMTCTRDMYWSYPGEYGVFIRYGRFYFSLIEMCPVVNPYNKGSIPISSFVEDEGTGIVTFKLPYTTEHEIGGHICKNCCFREKCNCVKSVTKDEKGFNRNITIPFGFEFNKDEFKDILRKSSN